MGEDLALPERNSLRTPMQWSASPGGGFTAAERAQQVRPMQTRGRYGCGQVNVDDQERDQASLLRWFQRMIGVLRECPEVGTGDCTVLDVSLPRHVLAHRCDAREGAFLALHNLADRAATVDLGRLDGVDGRPREVFADGAYDAPGARMSGIELHPYGYRWFKLQRKSSTSS